VSCNSDVMDALEDVLGATIDGVRLNLADGLLRLVLHLVVDDVERHWEIYFKEISECHVERMTAGHWEGAVIHEIVGSHEATGAIARLSLSGGDGSLAVSCSEIEVIEMRRVEFT
jgi:hypothetical protein